jgi:ATP-dependent Clp protease ATP-binding subunit ClpA
MGFGREGREGEDTEAIKRLFTPEFRNRLDAIIPFKALSPPIIASVVEKFVRELAAQLADRRVHIEVDELAKAWLAEKGYDPLYGARPLARVIQEHIKRPLADELLFGQLAKGGKVIVTIEDDKPSFRFVPASGPALLPPPEDEAEEDGYLPEPVA